MLKYMYNKNPKLVRSVAILMAVILAYGVFLIVDSIQREQREKGKIDGPTIKTSTEEFRAYDVDGLTDEQIEQWLIQEREKRGIDNGEEKSR